MRWILALALAVGGAALCIALDRLIMEGPPWRRDVPTAGNSRSTATPSATEDAPRRRRDDDAPPPARRAA